MMPKSKGIKKQMIKKTKYNSKNEIEIIRRKEQHHIGWQLNMFKQKKIPCFSAIPLMVVNPKLNGFQMSLIMHFLHHSTLIKTNSPNT